MIAGSGYAGMNSGSTNRAPTTAMKTSENITAHLQSLPRLR